MASVSEVVQAAFAAKCGAVDAEAVVDGLETVDVACWAEEVVGGESLGAGMIFCCPASSPAACLGAVGDVGTVEDTLRLVEVDQAVEADVASALRLEGCRMEDLACRHSFAEVLVLEGAVAVQDSS